MDMGAAFRGGERRSASVPAALLTALVALGILIGCGDSGSPNLVVSGEALAGCLEHEQPVHGWTVERLTAAREESADVAIRWSRRGSPESGGLIVLPSIATARVFAEMIPFGVDSQVIREQRQNVVYLHPGGGGSKTPEPVNAAVERCTQTSTVKAGSGSLVDFHDCGDQPQIPPGRFVNDLRVAGDSCSDAVQHLSAAPLRQGTGPCTGLGSEATCFRVGLCCGLNVNFAGNRDVQFVYKTGV
jgi:hypothetical protein